MLKEYANSLGVGNRRITNDSVGDVQLYESIKFCNILEEKHGHFSTIFHCYLYQ